MTESEVAHEISRGAHLKTHAQTLNARLGVRGAIEYLLGYPDGCLRYELDVSAHPRDVHDNVNEAVALIARGEPEILTELLEDEFSRGEAQKFAFWLAWTLAHLHHSGAASVLSTGVQHKDQYVRWACCEGLKNLSDSSLVPLLNKASKDRSSMVRSCAVSALARFGDESSIPYLELRLKDKYAGIVKAAKEGISRIQSGTAPTKP
jgi:hypothetical protein